MLTRVESWFGQTVRRFNAPPEAAAAHERLRLWVFCAIALAKLIYFLGGTWDIQWHISVGRDSLFVPPHIVAGAGFVLGAGMALLMLAYETWLGRTGPLLGRTVDLLGARASLGLFIILFGYANAGVSIALDDMWHRAFGLDAKLWSPPHLYLMASTFVVDIGLLIGLAMASRALRQPFTLRSGWGWAFVLVGAYTLDCVHFATSEAFLVGYPQAGPGLAGLVFPILMGVLLPLPLLLIIGLSGRSWPVAIMIVLVLIMQYIGTGFAELGFALLQPVSQIEEFLRTTPNTTIGITRDFAARNGYQLVGLQQAWTMWLSLPALLLVALLDLRKGTQRNPLLAAPVYSLSLLLVCALVFPFTPALAANNTSLLAYAQAAMLVLVGGLLSGSVGLWLARLATPLRNAEC